MRVCVLGLEADSGDESAARKMEALLDQVLVGMPGVEVIRLNQAEPGRAKQAEKLIERCGDQPDCRLRIGEALGAQVLIFGHAASAGKGGALVDLEILDVGSACKIRKLSRSLMGSAERQQQSLDHSLTEVLFPERMLGCIELDIQPEGAAVYLDGKLHIKNAKSKERLSDLHTGSHTLRISKTAHADFYAIVQVPYKDVTRLVVQMRPATGQPAGNIKPADPRALRPEYAWYERWWVWAVVGAVVAGGVTAGVVLGN